jgi:hypothetical protein
VRCQSVFQQAAVITDPLDTRGGFTEAGISAERCADVSGQNGLWNEFKVEDLATPRLSSPSEARLGMVQLAA